MDHWQFFGIAPESARAVSNVLPTLRGFSRIIAIDCGPALCCRYLSSLYGLPIEIYDMDPLIESEYVLRKVWDGEMVEIIERTDYLLEAHSKGLDAVYIIGGDGRRAAMIISAVLDNRRCITLTRTATQRLGIIGECISVMMLGKGGNTPSHIYYNIVGISHQKHMHIPTTPIIHPFHDTMATPRTIANCVPELSEWVSNLGYKENLKVIQGFRSGNHESSSCYISGEDLRVTSDNITGLLIYENEPIPRSVVPYVHLVYEYSKKTGYICRLMHIPFARTYHDQNPKQVNWYSLNGHIRGEKMFNAVPL
jgi:hypothetical protein